MNFAAKRDFDALSKSGILPDCQMCCLANCGFKKIDGAEAIVKFHDLERGECLECVEGACLRFWNIIDGYGATTMLFRDGRRQILSIERAGDTICGAMATTESEQKLEALTGCRICEIDLSPAASRLLEDCAFLAMTARLMHERLEKSMAHSAVLGRLDSQERVTYFLAEMAFLQDGNGSLVTLPMSREDIADYLGLNTDSVSRVLGRIRKSGLFRFVSPTEYTVPDIEAVARRLPIALPSISAPTHFSGGQAS